MCCCLLTPFGHESLRTLFNMITCFPSPCTYIHFCNIFSRYHRMSARDLEDFIKVIESAESFSIPRPSSNISYSTDIFQSKTNSKELKDHPSIKNHSKRKPENVPNLWKGTENGSEFLGSSWGSTSVQSGRSPATSRSTADSERPTTATSTKSSIKAITDTAASSSNRTSPTKSLASSSTMVKNPIMTLQNHTMFGRVKCTDLSPSTTPSSSPASRRRSNGTKPFMETSLKTSLNSSMSSTTSASPPKSSPSKSRTSDSSSSSARSVIEIVKAESPGSPRKPLAPRITIRQTSVRTHIHPKKDTRINQEAIEKVEPEKLASTPGQKRNIVRKPKTPKCSRISKTENPTKGKKLQQGEQSRTIRI